MTKSIFSETVVKGIDMKLEVCEIKHVMGMFYSSYMKLINVYNQYALIKMM